MFNKGFIPRTLPALGALICAGLLSAAYYFQFARHLEPCPLCIFQRLFYLAAGLVFLVAAIHNRARIIYGILSGIFSLGGAAVATRQVWLQHLPADQVPECGPGLNYMLEAFPIGKTLRMVLRGSGECAKVDWRFLGFSMAEWSLAAFIFLFILAILIARSRK